MKAVELRVNQVPRKDFGDSAHIRLRRARVTTTAHSAKAGAPVTEEARGVFDWSQAWLSLRRRVAERRRTRVRRREPTSSE